jgi:hypothetical protein
LRLASLTLTCGSFFFIWNGYETQEGTVLKLKDILRWHYQAQLSTRADCAQLERVAQRRIKIFDSRARREITMIVA